MVEAVEKAEPAERPRGEFKDRLAWAVFGLSTVGIFTVAVIYALNGGENSAREVFSTLVPLFGTWVGTILAFYFSRENFKEANDAVNRAFARLTPDQRLQQTGVRQVMITRKAIKDLKIPASGSEADISVTAMKKLVSDGYSRVPIFTPEDAVKYVVHGSQLNKFILESTEGQPGFSPDNAKLSDLLAHPVGDKTLSDWVSQRAFVKADATLADARDAMIAMERCQDVFVTQTGKAEEPVLGWLTNTDITRDL